MCWCQRERRRYGCNVAGISCSTLGRNVDDDFPAGGNCCRECKHRGDLINEHNHDDKAVRSLLSYIHLQSLRWRLRSYLQTLWQSSAEMTVSESCLYKVLAIAQKNVQ